jgi:hypothetical protein
MTRARATVNDAGFTSSRAGQLVEEAVVRVCSASVRMSLSTGRPIALTNGPTANQYR